MVFLARIWMYHLRFLCFSQMLIWTDFVGAVKMINVLLGTGRWWNEYHYNDANQTRWKWPLLALGPNLQDGFQLKSPRLVPAMTNELTNFRLGMADPSASLSWRRIVIQLAFKCTHAYQVGWPLNYFYCQLFSHWIAFQIRFEIFLEIMTLALLTGTRV